MLVIADSTPINILIRIEGIDLLAVLFGEVVIPRAVELELMHEATPEVIRTWMSNRPTWLRVIAAGQPLESRSLGAGEREAIALARELNADLLLVDDGDARKAAMRLGIAVTGTLGFLELAGERN